MFSCLKPLYLQNIFVASTIHGILMLKTKENGSKTSGIWFLRQLGLGVSRESIHASKKKEKFGTIPSTPQLRLNEIQLGIGILLLPHSLLELCWRNSFKRNILGTEMKFWTTLHGSCVESQLPELFLGDNENNRWKRSRVLFVEKKRRLVLNGK